MDVLFTPLLCLGFPEAFSIQKIRNLNHTKVTTPTVVTKLTIAMR
jgi:hypothetical protein